MSIGWARRENVHFRAVLFFFQSSSRLTFFRSPTAPYISVGAYIMDCRDPTATADCNTNLSRDFKRLIIQHLAVIARSSQGLSISPECTGNQSVSAAASQQQAHICNVSKVHFISLSLARAVLHNCVLHNVPHHHVRLNEVVHHSPFESTRGVWPSLLHSVSQFFSVLITFSLVPCTLSLAFPLLLLSYLEPFLRSGKIRGKCRAFDPRTCEMRGSSKPGGSKWWPAHLYLGSAYR
jgi:hypothetical protein